MCSVLAHLFFFFNDTATTEIYTLSLHDALPISNPSAWHEQCALLPRMEKNAAHLTLVRGGRLYTPERDRKSTRLNSSHANISYAVFCLKKKKNTNTTSLCYSLTN